MKNKKIFALGYDLSTTALTVVGVPLTYYNTSEEVCVSIPMRGATIYQGQPAFDLKYLPGLFTEAIAGIVAQGYEISSGGIVSGSVRQHDMVLVDHANRPLRPALSWQCNAATAEVQWLKSHKAETIVGRLEPRLILPKLMWALKQDSGLGRDIVRVMTTGDFISSQLTGGAQTLCSSEALSNGLLNQADRCFPYEFIYTIPGPCTSWFPKVVRSGTVINPANNNKYLLPEWAEVRSLLPGWRVIAGLGDNHAGAVGSGLNGRNTIVISAGTSGTVTRAVKLGAATAGYALQFEFFDDTLLLLMMADCASWYSRFIKQFGGGIKHVELDTLAMAAQECNYLLPYPTSPDQPFPEQFCQLPLDAQARTIQYSIAFYLGQIFYKMWKEEVVNADNYSQVWRVVLTGGLTASPYFRKALKQIIRKAGFVHLIRQSSRNGPLANQAAVLGALVNAVVGGGLFSTREEAMVKVCPVVEF